VSKGNSQAISVEWSKTMITGSQTQVLSNPADCSLEESIASVREALAGLRYGAVSLTVHDGRVVQIDVTEKKRLKPS